MRAVNAVTRLPFMYIHSTVITRADELDQLMVRADLKANAINDDSVNDEQSIFKPLILSCFIYLSHGPDILSYSVLRA